MRIVSMNEDETYLYSAAALALEKLGASLSDEQRAKRGRAIAARRAS